MFFSETTTEDKEGKEKSWHKKAAKNNGRSIREGRKRLRGIFSYQQEGDTKFLEAEEARERRELEGQEKRRKDDQEFLLKLAQVLQK